jgi:hypothetical protein
MKKFIVFVGVFLFLISNVLAFDIFDENSQERTYFSLNKDHVFVESSDNLSVLNISYNILGENRTKVYNFIKCNDKFCVDFELANLMENENDTFISSKTFNLKSEDIEKTIYLDIESPILNITNFTFEKDEKEIYFEFSYSDNFDKIKRIDLFKKENNNLVFIDNLS